MGNPGSGVPGVKKIYIKNRHKKKNNTGFKVFNNDLSGMRASLAMNNVDTVAAKSPV
jgi:hypothetical protein